MSSTDVSPSAKDEICTSDSGIFILAAISPAKSSEVGPASSMIGPTLGVSPGLGACSRDVKVSKSEAWLVIQSSCGGTRLTGGVAAVGALDSGGVCAWLDSDLTGSSTW